MVGLESFLLLVPGRWAACWSSNLKAPGSFVRGLMPLRGVGKARDPGGGSCSLSSTTSSSRRQCDGGGGSGLFSDCDSFISSVSCLLCQPPFWGCQSRPKLVPQEAEAGPCSYYWRRRIQYTSRLVFAFFDSIIGGVFLSI